MKIFGVGPNKTGTVSIAEACQRLGLRVLHDRKKGERICEALKVQANESKLLDPVIDELDNYDVFLDGPYYEVISEIKNCVDDPRFICLFRNIDDWVNSRIVHCLHNRVMGSGKWIEIDTLTWVEEYKEINKTVFGQLGHGNHAIYMNVAAGDGWDKLCSLIGCDVPDSPFPCYHTTPEKLLQIHSKKSRRRPLRRAPIILGVRSMSDWQVGQNLLTSPWGDGWEKRLQWWDEVFSMPYHTYRFNLQKIAKENWSRIEGLDSIVSIRSWQPELFHDAIIVPIDDDDWLAPQICHVIRNQIQPDTTAISWQADRIECPHCYAINTCGDANFYITNGYALTPNYRDAVGDEQFKDSLLWHVHAADHAKEHSRHLASVLGAAPRTWASVTTLGQFNSAKELADAAVKAKSWHRKKFNEFGDDYREEFIALWMLNQKLLKGIRACWLS